MIGLSLVTDVHLGSRFLIKSLDTFLHIFNVTTGTINSAQYSIYMHSIENLILQFVP